MNWWSAQTKLGKRESRKLENNTYLLKRGDDFVVKLHSTDIITFKKNGNIVLSAGGWLTVTTKDRINKYADNVRIYSNRGHWVLQSDFSQLNPPVEFRDGITVIPDGRTLHGVSKTELAKIERHNAYVERLLKTYLDKFTLVQAAKTMQEDGSGDCFFCKAGTNFGGQDHLLSHLKERYYMPTLILRAIQHANYGYPFHIYDMWKDSLNRNSRFPSEVKRRLRKYFRDNLLQGARSGKRAA